MNIHIPLKRTYLKTIHELNLKKQLQKNNWTFNQFRYNIILDETTDWEQHYLPINIKNKTVLDVGAGAGETARFYLQHGASKVICIEPNPHAYRYLLQNAQTHPIIPYQEFFCLKHLDLPYDFAKIDIEGYEEILLDAEIKKPMVVEVHSVLLAEKFRAKGWRVPFVGFDDERGFSGCTRYAYWQC